MAEQPSPSTAIPPRTGIARVFIGPSPPDAPHPGYRGPITIDECGVHVGTDCDCLYVEPGETFAFPLKDTDWHEVFHPCTIPWARVDLIEWGNDAAGWTPRELEVADAV